MADRHTHAWGLLSVALALLFGIPSLAALHKHHHPPWWAVAGIIIGLLCLLASLALFILPPLLTRRNAKSGAQARRGAIEAKVADQRLYQFATVDPLQQECADTHREITQFLSDRLRDDPARKGHPLANLPPRTSKKRRLEEWNRSNEEILSFVTETMARYSERFGARAAYLAHELHQRGLLAASDLNVFDHTTNPLGIEAVARLLGISAERLRAEQQRTPSAPLPDHVADRVIRSMDYPSPIHGRRFERCEIRGTVHLPGSHITDSKWLLGRFEIVPDLQSLPSGTLSFIDCLFEHCTFAECTAVGTPDQIVSLRSAFGIAE